MKTRKYNINREAEKISALSSGKIDNYEFLTGEELLLFDQSQITEQAKFIYSPLAKAVYRQTKAIQDQGKKQVEALRLLKTDQQSLIKFGIPKNQLSKEFQNELDKIEYIEKRVNMQNFVYKTNK